MKELLEGQGLESSRMDKFCFRYKRVECKRMRVLLALQGSEGNGGVNGSVE